MARTANPHRFARRRARASLLRALGLHAALLIFFAGGCGLPSRTETASTGPATNSTTAISKSVYVTLPLDDVSTEWEFVQWLNAGGVPVEKDSNGDDRIFDTPACRAILVRYRRMLRLRLDVIAQNLANVNTTHDAQGAPKPYRRRFVVTDAGGAAEVREDLSPLLARYSPGNPDADSKGYVQFPNVDPATENVDVIQASNLYRVVTRILVRFDPTYIDTN